MGNVLNIINTMCLHGCLVPEKGFYPFGKPCFHHQPIRKNSNLVDSRDFLEVKCVTFWFPSNNLTN